MTHAAATQATGRTANKRPEGNLRGSRGWCYNAGLALVEKSKINVYRAQF